MCWQIPEIGVRSTWGWLEVDLQVYFVGTRTARLSKSVIYDIGTKIILLKKCVFFLTGKSRFWKRCLQHFLDLKNSKACTHVCNLLNLSDLKRVAKILFKNTKYSKKSEKMHAALETHHLSPPRAAARAGAAAVASPPPPPPPRARLTHFKIIKHI